MGFFFFICWNRVTTTCYKLTGADNQTILSLVLLESKSVPKIAPFGKGNNPRDHMTLTHTLRNEKSGRGKWCSADNTGSPWMLLLILWLCLAPRRSLWVSWHWWQTPWRVRHPLWTCPISPTAYFPQRINMPTLELDFFIATSVWGNILITGGGRDFLIDWDLCLNLNNDQASAKQPGRTVSSYFFAVDLFLTASLGNVVVHVSCTSS